MNVILPPEHQGLVTLDTIMVLSKGQFFIDEPPIINQIQISVHELIQGLSTENILKYISRYNNLSKEVLQNILIEKESSLPIHHHQELNKRYNILLFKEMSTSN